VCIVGIDGTNLRGGGGITHLRELIASGHPPDQGIEHVVLWGGAQTLDQLPDRSWLTKVSVKALNRGFFSRVLWQRFSLGEVARTARCDIVFAPGGSYDADFTPYVSMCRNMLPFDNVERARFPLLSFRRLQYELLRWVQGRTFRNADATIFLTNYARTQVAARVGCVDERVRIIPHGVSKRFSIAPRPQMAIDRYSAGFPMRIVYVSIINHYKHQWCVVEAITMLRRAGLPVVLTLAGPSVPEARVRLDAMIARCDPDGEFVTLLGAVPYQELHRLYEENDIGVFASSCENMPNILLEMMAAGLPIVCSNRGPMPEILNDAGMYCNPEDSEDIARSLRAIIANVQSRNEMAEKAYRTAALYSWENCATETFALLAETARVYRDKDRTRGKIRFRFRR